MKFLKIMPFVMLFALSACSKGKNYGSEVNEEEFDAKVQEIEQAEDPGYTRARLTSRQKGNGMGQNMDISFHAVYERNGDSWVMTEENDVPEGFNVGEYFLSCTIDKGYNKPFNAMANVEPNEEKSKFYIGAKTVSYHCEGGYENEKISVYFSGDATWNAFGYLVEYDLTENVNYSGQKANANANFKFEYFK